MLQPDKLIRRLRGALSDKGVAFWLVARIRDSAAIRDHVRMFGYPGQVLRDSDQVFVRW